MRGISLRGLVYLIPLFISWELWLRLALDYKNSNGMLWTITASIGVFFITHVLARLFDGVSNDDR